MFDDINDRLKEIRNEDIIWIIYLGIIFLSFYSNNIEKKYFFTKDNNLKKEYRSIIIFIFSILIIVYLYFVKDSLDSVKKLTPNDTDEKKKLTYLSLFASILIAISGAIFLYIALKDENLDIELAFN